MAFATQTHVHGGAQLRGEWLAIVGELDRRGALGAVGAAALLDLGRRCADHAEDPGHAAAPQQSSGDDRV